MGFKIFLFVVTMLIPVMMIAFGKIFKKKAPGTINGVYGYRTTMSMKNQDTWQFAHHLCGKLWEKWGIVSAIISAIVLVILMFTSEDVMSYGIIVLETAQIIFLIGPIFVVEKALKKNFDCDGNRR